MSNSFGDLSSGDVKNTSYHPDWSSVARQLGLSRLEAESLDFHSIWPKGKIAITPTKATYSEKALSLAYSPGVAGPCKAIAQDPLLAYEFTNKGNLVAVISNGSAVLGLGSIGPEAAKPVMEGKALLFKQFAGIDVYDVEIRAQTVDEMVEIIAALEPTFGGINLEDIKAPECFELEEKLKARLKIPVFHDDQHGTAIVAGAALINACDYVGKALDQIRVVINGAGASAIACAQFFVSLGVKRENVILCDSHGVIFKGRTQNMNQYKAQWAQDVPFRTLEEALVGADVFVGLSVKGALKPEALKRMNDRPIIFALANPDPEITPEEAKRVRPDAIVATGRSDYPNQVNNVLGFPSVFRAALDVRATQINEAMKIAAAKALAALAREEVPDRIHHIYGQKFRFGPDYLIPKPFDTRVLLRVAPAVARAAMESGVARRPIKDFEAYRDFLESLQGVEYSFLRQNIHRVHAQAAQLGRAMKIVFPEAESERILKAIPILRQENICDPILIGNSQRIQERAQELGLLDVLEGVTIWDPESHPLREKYAQKLFEWRSRKGVHRWEALRLIKDPQYFAAVAVKLNDADGLVTGVTLNYADAVRPILQVIGVAHDYVPMGVNLLLIDGRLIMLMDTTIHVDPDVPTLVKMARQGALVMEYFNQTPRVAFLSFSNFTGRLGSAVKMQQAAEVFKAQFPQWMADGEIQADSALNPELVNRLFPFSDLKESANILVFPNLDSANIGYKLLSQLSRGKMLGPFLLGVRRAANVLHPTTTVDNIIDSVVLTTLVAQYTQIHKEKL